MPCYQPVPGRQDSAGQRVQLWPALGTQNIAIPCGVCLGCRASRAAAWGHRAEHEATKSDHNTFVTLTVDDNHLGDGQLRPDDLQRFIKRLRRNAERPTSNIQQTNNSRISYLACGEYGEHTDRPHYHLCLFNCGFADGKKIGKNGEHTLYTSDTLHSLWTDGNANYGPFTPAAATYVAKYTIKRQGKGDHDTDGVYRQPPFIRVSLRPPLGSEWLKKYATDLRQGYLVDGNGVQTAIPRTYLEKLKKTGGQLYDEIEYNKHKHKKIDTPETLRAKEIIHRRLLELTEKRKL